MGTFVSDLKRGYKSLSPQELLTQRRDFLNSSIPISHRRIYWRKVDQDKTGETIFAIICWLRMIMFPLFEWSISTTAIVYFRERSTSNRWIITKCDGHIRIVCGSTVNMLCMVVIKMYRTTKLDNEDRYQHCQHVHTHVGRFSWARVASQLWQRVCLPEIICRVGCYFVIWWFFIVWCKSDSMHNRITRGGGCVS